MSARGLSRRIDFDEVKERIGLNDRYEEYAIHDYELPFQIEEYTPIEEVNRLCALVEDFPDYVQDNLEEIMCYYNSLDELANEVDEIIVWDGCESMSDVADQMLQEGLISNETLRRYFDSTAYGRDLDLEGLLGRGKRYDTGTAAVIGLLNQLRFRSERRKAEIP